MEKRKLKSKKVVSFVKRRRKSSSKTKKGHRQQLTLIKIIEILNTGAEKTNIAEAVSGRGIKMNYSLSANKKSTSLEKGVAKSEGKSVEKKDIDKNKKKAEK